MNKLKVLIVEDEILIAETIRLYLIEYGYDTSSICISYDEAIEKYHLDEPDLILLDIRLFGEKSGIDIAHYLNNQKNKPPYIFLTSQFDKRILDSAIQTLPFGYITKPFTKETLWTSIESAYKLYKQNGINAAIEVYDGKQVHLLTKEEILYIQSEHVYTRYILNNNSEILCRVSFQKCVDTLMRYNFIRCHRTFCVNPKYIKRWNKIEISMKNDQNIPISSSYKSSVLAVLLNELP
ncbi:MAG: DNA-binding response regulator [Saprospiraceae bacterium]|nr:DNA-binding response regulator [Saprospiraceae bacterium]